jgi:hypothetical protein
MLIVAQALAILFIGGALLLTAWILLAGSAMVAFDWLRTALRKITASLRA